MKQLRIVNWTAKALAVALVSYGTAQANNIAFYKTVFNTDFAVGGVGGMRGTGHGTIALSGISGTVTKAYLYWQGPTDTTDPKANATVLVNNQTVVGTHIGFSHNNFWGFRNSQAYRADVTEYVTRAGIYSLDSFTKPNRIDVNGASLVVFFDDGNPDNNRDVVLFEGNDSNINSSYDGPGWSVTLAGINYVSGMAAMQLHVSDGQKALDDALILNGSNLVQPGSIFQGDSVPSPNQGPNNDGCLWDIKTLVVTSRLHPGSNTLSLTHASRTTYDAVSAVLVIIDLPAGAAPRVQRPPSVECQPPVTMFSAGSATIRAQVRDPDGDAITFNISINGVSVKSGSILAGISSNLTTCEVTHTFAPGAYDVLCTVSDGLATANCATRVTVADGTPPTITCPTSQVRPIDPGQCSARVNYSVTATDDQPGVTISCAPLSGSVFSKGMTTVNCTATDAAGNKATCSFIVTVRDLEAPMIQHPPEIRLNVEAGQCDAVVNYNVTLADNCPGATVTCSPASDSVFPAGTTTVTCNAVDSSGNGSSSSFQVIVTAASGNLVLRKTANKLSAGLGDPVTYAYEAVNAGCGPLTDLVIVDDNGTPTFKADDFVVATNVTLAAGEMRVFTRSVLLPIALANPNTAGATGFITAEVLPDGNIKVRFVQGANINDNSYGANAIGWAGGHKFSDLTSSDSAEFRFKDRNRKTVLQFKLDYISASSAYPSGYGTLGVTGGDGRLTSGSAQHILSYSTSLTENLNKAPFLSNVAKYIVDSPATSDPNRTLWEYRMIYTVVVSKAAFGNNGFGIASVIDSHNSPAKTNSSSPAPVSGSVTNIAVATAKAGSNAVTASAQAVVQLDASSEPCCDSDDDGLSDDWEIMHFRNLKRDGNGDQDQDGHTDREEFLAGTDPSKKDSVLQIVSMSTQPDGRMLIVWGAVHGKGYTVQCNNDVRNAIWKDASGLIIANGSTASCPIVRHGNCFYRVVLVP